MRAFTAAAVQVAPVTGPLTTAAIKSNVDNCVRLVERCAEATGAELIVLPEAASTGFTPGVDPLHLWNLVDRVPGRITTPIQDVAARLRLHVVFGTYERGAEPGVVYNSAVLVGPTGDVLATYRKTHLFCGEARSDGGWATPGDAVAVVRTELGSVGLIICFDGDYPELSRVTAIRGAEVICRPSALLRSADIWELTNRARAYDNHVFLVGANATGVDPAGVIYFGNSMIVTPIGEVVARAASHEGWVSALLDPATALASLTPGSNVPQRFDHLADRNLDFIRAHLDELAAPAHTPFPYARPRPVSPPPATLPAPFPSAPI